MKVSSKEYASILKGKQKKPQDEEKRIENVYKQVSNEIEKDQWRLYVKSTFGAGFGKLD